MCATTTAYIGISTGILTKNRKQQRVDAIVQKMEDKKALVAKQRSQEIERAEAEDFRILCRVQMMRDKN